MWRASVVALALLAGSALADPDEPARVADHARDGIARQLADESAAIDRTLAVVIEKLAAIDVTRGRRLAAAYRVLQAPPGDDHLMTARRRAAARMLVERELAERRLLADEAGQLRDARARTQASAARVSGLVLPTELARPAAGTIARNFGTFTHERSKTTLSRRGIDLEVETRRAPVAAMADGIVRYAGPIRGLDAGVIIDHGGYLTILAKLGEIGVPVGAPVKRGDPIGRAARHRVYIEVRVEVGPAGVPIDPEPLWDAAED